MLKRSKPVFTVVLTLASAALIASAGVYAQQGNSAGKGKGAEKAQTAWTAPGHVNAKGNGHPNHKGNGYGHGPHEGQEHDDSDGGKNKNTGKGKSKGKSGSSPDTPVVDVPEATDSCAIYYAGQYTPVGSVCVTVEGDQLRVDYIMEGDWLVSGTHLWVGDTLASAPRTKSGNPIPGQFPYHGSTTPTDVYSYTIPLSQLNVDADALCTDNSTLLIGAHGSVSNGSSSESAWAGEIRFTEKGNWATYFGVAPDCGDPEDPVDPPVDPEPQVCETFEANEDFASSTKIKSVTFDLGKYASVSFDTTNSRDGISASTTIKNIDSDKVITFANLFVVVGESVVNEPNVWTASVSDDTGDYVEGKISHQFENESTPDGDFSLEAEVEICILNLEESDESA